jgi:tRNA pseudouridine32 synthase/23S rRNA pseudouridine746 synthase
LYTLIDDQVDFLVINKEANVSVHDESGDGLIKQLRADFNNNEIAPVHRLDKATSGLMLCSKHGQAGSVLSSLLRLCLC